jgi:glycerophosphoryl diester phosphodiesterase
VAVVTLVVLSCACGSEKTTNEVTQGSEVHLETSNTNPVDDTTATDVLEPGDTRDEDEADAAGHTVLGFPADHPLLAPGLLNIAHRGGGKLRPEETLAAYDHAVEVGADMLEMDLHATKDGVVVLIHDATVDRTTDGSGSVKEMSFDELRQLDAGYRFTGDGGATYPYRGQGLRVATLRELLERHPTQLFSAELKQTDPPIIDAVLSVLAETGMEDRVILVSFSDATVRAIREKNPRIITGAGIVEMLVLGVLSDEQAATWTPPCPFFQMAQKATTPTVLSHAHANGARVQAWTVNKADEMRALLDLGVDGIMTDDPELLESVLRE